MTERIIIAGAGQAGGTAAVQLRRKKFAGEIVLLGDEPHVPYERPPLSKALLAGTIEKERTFLKKPDWYADNQIDFRPSTLISSIDITGQTVKLHDGSEESWDRLLIATGSRVRRLDMLPGADLAGLHYVRTIADTEGLQAEIAPGKKLAIVGGGYIGLEVAAVAQKLGCEVTVLEGMERVMNRVVAPEISAFYEKVHQEAGVDLRTGVQVAGFAGGDRVEQVLLQDGTEVAADIVVIGVGIVPNQELAADAGIDVDNGIVVNEFAETSARNVTAAGDCTNHPNSLLHMRLRLESVQNAVDQGQTAANTMLGEKQEYAAMPWFWSDQYDLTLQIVGLSEPGDDVVLRGDPESRSFSALYIRDGIVVAANCINAAKDFMAARKFLVNKPKADPSALADAETPLKEILA